MAADSYRKHEQPGNNGGRDQGNSNKAEPMTSEYEPGGPFDRFIHAGRTQATQRLEASCGRADCQK